MDKKYINVRNDYDSLKTERRNPRTMNIDRLTTYEMMKLMNDESRVVYDAVDSQLDEISRAVDVIAESLSAGGHLIYVGAGTSGRLGIVDASECPPTFGTDPRTVRAIIAGGQSAMFRAGEGEEDNEEQGALDLTCDKVQKGDVVVGLSASGGAPYVIGALKKAKELGAIPIGISCNPGSRMHDICYITITPYVGPEVITGSSRLKAGTAQKLVLNMLSTGAMIKTGKVRENLMINVKPSNAKLRMRCIGIVKELGKCDEETAAALIDKYGDIQKSLDALEKGTEI